VSNTVEYDQLASEEEMVRCSANHVAQKKSLSGAGAKSKLNGQPGAHTLHALLLVELMEENLESALAPVLAVQGIAPSMRHVRSSHCVLDNGLRGGLGVLVHGIVSVEETEFAYQLVVTVCQDPGHQAALVVLVVGLFI